MNCDYLPLKDAYSSKENLAFDLRITYNQDIGGTTPGPLATTTPATATKSTTPEKFENPKPKSYIDFRNFGNAIHDSIKPKFNSIKDLLPPYTDLAASKSIFNFRDANFNSKNNNTIFLGPIPVINVPINSTFFLSTSENPALHKAGSIGYFNPDLFKSDRDKAFFDYELVLLDKNFNYLPNNRKTNDSDALYIKLNNRQSSPSSSKNEKIGLIYIVTIKPNSPNFPKNIKSPELIPNDFPKLKLLVSFS